MKFKDLISKLDERKCTLLHDYNQEEITQTTVIYIKDSDNYLYSIRIIDLLKMRPLSKWLKYNDYSIQNISNWLKINNKQLELLPNQIYKNSYELMLFRCLKCNNIIKLKIVKLLVGNECNVCNGDVILEGYNDLSSVRPDLVKYFKNPEITKQIKVGSHKKVELICPSCGFEKSMVVEKLAKRRFSCNQCSDNMSIPNKFILNILSQLKINFCTEHVFSNTKYRYDFYLPDNKITIEAHGRQHYDMDFGFVGSITTSDDQKQIDVDKKELSESLGNIHLEIDCRNSDYDFLKNSSINILSKYFDLLDIDWNIVYSNCSNSFIIESANLYNDDHTTRQISDELKLSMVTIVRYLHIATKLNLTNYNPTESAMRSIHPAVNKKVVYQYDLNGELIYIYDSISSAESLTDIKGISKAIINKTIAGGFLWSDVIIYSLDGFKTNYKNTRSVCKYDLNDNFITQYDSIKSASEQEDASHSSIVLCCQGKYKSVNGFVWKYSPVTK